MKLRTFQEAVEDYEQLTGEDFEYKVPYENLKILDSNEFMTWRIGEKNGQRYFEIRQTYGFMKNFVDFIREVMEANGLEWIVTSTQRDPRAHIKKWKMELLPEYCYEFEGRRYNVLKGHISNLR